MWDERFRLPEAAEMIGLTYPILKGWRERGVITTVGRDTTRPGHPHFIPFIEIVRLALAARMQRLSRLAFDARWNPGPFLRALQKGVTDKELQQITEGRTRGESADHGNDKVASVLKEDEEAADGSGDVLMIIDPSDEERNKKGRAVQLVSLERFRRGLDAYLGGESAYVIVNVSDVFRRLLARRDEIKDRQPGGRRFTSDGWALSKGWSPGSQER